MTAATDGHFAQLQQELLDLYEVRARSRFVELAQPQMRAHVLEAGDGPPVVFLHGGDGEAVTWAPLLAQLQDDVHLYGPDRPGFGLSDRFKYRTVDLRRHAGDFTVSLLDALGLQSAVLMGGSMGGFFALATALDHPERVSSLILMGIPAGFTPKLPLPVRVIFNMPVLPGLFMRRAATIEGQHKQYEQMFKTDPASLPELYFRTRVAGVKRPGAQQTWPTLMRRLTGVRGNRPGTYLGAELAHVTQPTLVIYGEHDWTPDEVRAAAERMPNASVHFLPGVGHFPFLQASEETARAVREFVAANAPHHRGLDNGPAFIETKSSAIR
jgi:pimeloyl-ACP methyl ester carboxylesterase